MLHVREPLDPLWVLASLSSSCLRRWACVSTSGIFHGLTRLTLTPSSHDAIAWEQRMTRKPS
ncbi:hypothetical protein I79_002333 [Cricetulus griseus]|uniref:Uncharacterized protein n=1 Tax=Cricetulus griseus TaxID=10029 RepID=G3GX98_CRIGR|nr:hypothetical protein I79_002333 [Cricetulus griseus]